MKKSALLSLAVVLLIGLMSVSALAYEVTVWKEDPIQGPVVTSLARAFAVGGPIQHPGMPGFGCNSTQQINWYTEVNVAQWLYWEFTANQWTWYVRKPGVYYADCIQGLIRSNGDVLVSFEGFGNLMGNPDETVDTEIEAWYGVTLGCESVTPPAFWVPADELGEFTINDGQYLHDGLIFKLWNRINVENCNSPTTFTNSGIITLTLANQQPWIVDGEWSTTYDYE